MLVGLPVVRISVAVGQVLFCAVPVEASETEAVAVDGPQRVVAVAHGKTVVGSDVATYSANCLLQQVTVTSLQASVNRNHSSLPWFGEMEHQQEDDNKQ